MNKTFKHFIALAFKLGAFNPRAMNFGRAVVRAARIFIQGYQTVNFFFNRKPHPQVMP
jgi:hypothetical protein